MSKIERRSHSISLIYNLAIFDLKIRYRNSFLGFLWTILEPLFLLAILYFVFTNIFRFEIENYALYILLGLIIFNMFSRGTSMGLDSLLSKSNILKQIYIKREIPVVASVVTNFLMLCFEFIVFGAFMVALQFIPTYTIIFLPFVIIILFFLVVGLAFPLSLINVKYRDVRFIWIVLLQGLFFLSPIFYNLEILPDFLQSILYFSPIAHVISMAQNVTLYNTLPTLEEITVLILLTALVFLLGYAIFRKYESKIIEEL